MTKAQNELAQFLANINAEAKANGSPFGIEADVAFWAEYGVYTVEEFELFEARGVIWDLYKSVHGIRPRWMNLNEMTLEELNHEIEKLQEELVAQREAEEAEAEARVLERQEHDRIFNEALHGAPIENRIEL